MRMAVSGIPYSSTNEGGFGMNPLICGVTDNWVHQREERDSPGAGCTERDSGICGAAFLGARVLGVDGGPG